MGDISEDWEADIQAAQDKDACKTCGLSIFSIPAIWRYVDGKTGAMLCRHWFGIPASAVPGYIERIEGDGDNARVVVDWADGGEALHQGNISRLRARGANLP